MQALEAQGPGRCEVLPLEQDEASAACDQKAAAVGTRHLHRLEQLHPIAELNKTPTVSLRLG